MRTRTPICTLLSVLIAFGIVTCNKDSTIGPVDNTTIYTRLTVNLSGMTPQLGQIMIFDVRSNTTLTARAIIDPLTAESDSIVMPGALPPGVTDSLCFFADVNGNGLYDPPPTDHAWRVLIPANGTVNFARTTSFTDIGTLPGLYNLEMNFADDFGIHGAGKLVEIRVADSLTGQTVGLYRKTAFGTGAQRIVIPGVLKSNTAYRVDFYADQNGNSSYDAPPADHAWRLFGRTPVNLNLVVDFIATTNYTDVKF